MADNVDKIDIREYESSGNKYESTYVSSRGVEERPRFVLSSRRRSFLDIPLLSLNNNKHLSYLYIIKIFFVKNRFKDTRDRLADEPSPTGDDDRDDDGGGH